ncbi:YeeE/YedE family protein (plasmid) [Vibrio sp. SS-MA-C1-2]|uniref:YeeE/YedE family protein n=1 Tax=Vibrio sp. SS-MA-C1-2 TaxID=2908646 RepID=UPI001F4805C5|nr:YeeE/YedE thiosulfate transporter family protein [Vibrio sp. SS-MA-C1-2]UJF17650.1 YeeE/YedE family protein [Vibrio sp. SS-MA-C1-2]UJF20377.1 YeeE/YedE family protein [Vibrio sp. SS-MA-C1-2]
MTFQLPWLSLFGGMLLGVSAVLLLLFNGKIAGISGIVSGLLSPTQKDFFWRVLFIIGMVIGGILGSKLFGTELPSSYDHSYFYLAFIGFIVGIGTKLGNGCTSGHGICGMGRLSKRSITATCTFMLVAAITVFIRFHVL